ncbi:NUDIX domain-containing protein [Rummeliibacillus pycnus]|uniref:NUDIX domain-containing protein n=1 Tax=Rummeliibacillus pycnus TaxID=101070 RepID=UPI000C997FAA|nr:NUDIX domain-containing protein [Rummeliibacillus pycnus]
MKTITVDWDGQKVKLTWLPQYPLQHQDIITSVHAICFQNDKVLLSKIKKRGFNYPGGHIEKGESPEEALHREVYEEAYVKGEITYLGVLEVNHKENHFFNTRGKYPIMSYQVFYRMDINTCDSFLRENESVARIWVEPSEIPYVIDDHEISLIILEEALSNKKEQQKLNGLKKIL